ncbi:5556_t:CDS:2 [Funneliformis caledonium]|uniref:5556_t:CDS:1 n=1 Tax=Funneliformis caledonium TaxID=1117310 RepID=A0A9N9F450_9GLOM|nr:5556_t:CDS:2 [Funneliformis caledonium]
MSTVEIIGTRKKCITRNNKSIFKVTAGVDNDIYDLKKIIAENIPNVKAICLVLWRINLENNRNISLDESLDDRIENEAEKVGDVFTDDAGSNIRIIVGLSVNTDEHQVLKFMDLTSVSLFSQVCNTKNQNPLLYGVGKKWVYQPGQGLHEKLRNKLRMHYEYYLGGVVDKSFIPIYLFLSGAGTGKSRNAEEFYNMTLACLSDSKDLKLKGRIRNAWVFNISFENGNSLSYGVEKEAYSAIRTRILKQQLLEKHHELIIAEYEAPLPWQMFELLAKYEEIEMKDATIFLIVDGLHSINDGNDQSSDFFRTLTNIHDLDLSGAFVITLCTTMATNSIEVLKITHRKCVELPIASLIPPTICNNNNVTPVFEMTDHITKILVDDCGGLGRALEALQVILEKCDIKKVNVNDIMNDLRKDFVTGRAMLTRVLMESDKFIPGETQSGYLIAPYIWIWILTQSSDGEDPVHRDWCFCDYGDHKSNLNPKRPPGAQFWQHFEHFVASFRTLKSRMVNDNEDTNSANYTGNKKEIKCDNGIFDVRKGKRCIINGVSAPYCDAFLGLDLNSNIPNPNEVHQYKNLPKNTGYVDKSNWVEYFGPYAGRALTYAHVGSLDINNADKRDIELVEGVGPERADIIYNKRKFIDIDDAYNKTKIPKSILKRFKF